MEPFTELGLSQCSINKVETAKRKAQADTCIHGQPLLCRPQLQAQPSSSTWLQPERKEYLIDEIAVYMFPISQDHMMRTWPSISCRIYINLDRLREFQQIRKHLGLICIADQGRNDMRNRRATT